MGAENGKKIKRIYEGYQWAGLTNKKLQRVVAKKTDFWWRLAPGASSLPRRRGKETENDRRESWGRTAPVTSTSSARPEHLHNVARHVSVQKHLQMKTHIDWNVGPDSGHVSCAKETKTELWEYTTAMSNMYLTGKEVTQVWLLYKYDCRL